ncbi:PRE_C2HC domain-containing protein [Trichonephila clavipes]|nr:PRE_C2HC domain-containing protein [Trichonephila clavipes]
MDLDIELINGLTTTTTDTRHPCDTSGCAEHHTPLSTPTTVNDNDFPTLPKSASLKRKDTEFEFISPPNRKLSKNQNTQPNTEQNFRLNLSNKFNALEINDSEIDPVEGTSTGTIVKNVNTVVIKGLPKKAKPEDIHNDLIDLGFTVDRVSQLTGKITNQLLPVFLVSLPRNMTNATIFKLDKLSYLNVSEEGYDSKGVTQCYKCQQFNHTASNCHIKPKCLKCGEPHQTTDCKIDKVETMYCVNCEAYGHMANYSKCPLYPKPRKGASIKPNYTSIVNSLVRPNVSFAQAAAQQERNIEALIQANSNCVIFGDFNATHSAWNCSKNSPRGIRLKDFTDDNNLEIAFPKSPTRYGYNSSNTLDFAIISNFNYPYNIVSISDLSSDHNPVMLNFNIATPIHKDNPRAITTCWSAFRKILKTKLNFLTTLKSIMNLHSKKK